MGLIAFNVVANLLSSKSSKQAQQFNAFKDDAGFGTSRVPQATYLESQVYQGKHMQFNPDL